MISYRLGHGCLAFALALFCALSVLSIAQAQEGKPAATTLTIDPIGTVSSGKPVTILVQLATPVKENQGALANENIELSVDGVHVRLARTDASGAVSFSLPGNLPVGKHTITVEYAGSSSLLASLATAELEIVPVARTPRAPTESLASLLTIDPIAPVPVGQATTLAVQLSSATGEKVGAVGNEVLQLFVDDQPARRVRTNDDGSASIRVPDTVPVGKHTARVDYAGTRALLASSTSIELVIIPATLEIQTVPALAGVRFAIDGREFASDQAGLARIELNQAGTLALKILSVDSISPDTRIEFSRWLDEVYVPDRDVTVPLDKPLYLGFTVHQRVSQRFLDLASKPVDPKRVTSVLLKSSQGMAFKLTDSKPRWLQTSSIARRTTGLEETKIQYSVDKVIVDGSNVVNQSQQRFYVHENDEWPIQLLLYSARFQARDGLFKFPLGTGISLEHPDGSVEELPFGPDGDVSIRSLVRGIYRVKVSGAPGISPLSPVALSRDQDVELLVISYLDIALGAVLAASLGFGLLFVGRPKLFFMLGKPRVLAQSLADAYRSMPRVGGLRPAIRRLTAASANPFALSGATSRRSADVRRFTLSRTQSANAAALPAPSSALSQPADVQTRQPFMASLSAMARRIERALRHTPVQPTRRTPKRILAYAFFAALIAVVGALPRHGTANAPTAPAHDTSFVQMVPLGNMLAQANAAPTAQPAAKTVTASTAQPTAQQTSAPAQSNPAPAQPTPIPAPDTYTPNPGTQLHLSRVLNIKNTGEDVAQLQQRLRELGYFTYPTNTGYFGENTLRSITRFQTDQGLPSNGIVDSQTVELLNSCDNDCTVIYSTGENPQ